MSKLSNFDVALKIVSKWEGGWSDHKADPGGATKYGITHAVLSEWRGRKVSKKEVQELTYAEARNIYYNRYWLPIKGDSLPLSLAVVVFDSAVNQGPKRAIMLLQKAIYYQLNSSYKKLYKIDGVIGRQTITYLDVYVKAGYTEILARDFMAYRSLHYSSLTSLLKDFGFGWFRRLYDVFYQASKSFDIKS